MPFFSVLLIYLYPPGSISQWGEVSKPKKTSTKPKAKESAGLTESSGNSRPARGGRGDSGRGRARGAERARGSRGRAASHATTTNGHRIKDNQQLSIPTDESSGWGKTTTTDDSTAPAWGATDSTAETTTTPTLAPAVASTTTDPIPQPTSIPPQTAQKTWASMLRQSTAPKPAPKPKEVPAPKPAESIEPLPPVEPAAPKTELQADATPEETDKPTPPPAAVEAPNIVEPEVALPHPEDDLTKQNLEQLPDESNPPPTATVASTTADSWDPRQAQQTSAAVTPLSASQAQHQNARAAPSGFAASALKATERPTARMPSYQRRLLEQEEAVRMPGNREVDRAAVQFGAFSLNDGEDDIDGDREDPETRGQPPLESPSQPRATLPPVPQQSAPIPETYPTQKPVASLPQQSPSIGENPANPYYPTSQITNIHLATPVAPPTGPAATTAQRMSHYPQSPHLTNIISAPQAPSANQQFGRFGQTNAQESAGFPQKPYESFAQQQTAATSAGSFDSFPTATTQAPGPQNAAFSSAPGDYSSYYTADQHSRGAYNYYGQYNQQSGQNHHEGPNSQTRGFGGYNASQNDNLSQYPQSAAQQSRFGAAAAADAQNSGHNTPNPPSQTQQQQTSAQASQPQSNLHQQQPHGSQYPYAAHPYFSSPYYANYIQQHYGGAYGQGGYGGAPYGKGGMYGQPHQYGMSPQGPYDHASSPATSGFAQSSLGARDSGLGSSVDNYRAGSTQSGAQGSLGSGFGGIHDTFGRGSAYPQAGQGFGNPNAQASNVGSGDDLKPYGETKATGGPSPLAAAARPGSATNNTPAASGLPPPQSAQQGIGGYGGYPSHIQGHGVHSNQSAGSGYGLGGSSAQSHGSTPYGGGFGGNQGFSQYYGGRQQQQGGWGGNYH